MRIYKKLAGQTIIYGMGTIVPKILNYVILTAYYTRLFPVNQFGVITELYAYVTFLMIILTYGTETGFFRFSQDDSSNKVYGSLLSSLLITSTLFVMGMLFFSGKIAEALLYQGNERYIIILGIVVGIDSFSTIPFAKLRKEERSFRFALLKVLNVVVTILAILFFYEAVPVLQDNYGMFSFFKQRGDIVFVLYSNLIASAVILLFLVPDIVKPGFKFDFAVLKAVLSYSFPLLIAGLAGTINDALDRVLMKHLIVDKSEALYVLGIYGANFRIAMLLYIFVQMFRYAVEPFYFSFHGEKDEKVAFSGIMRLFIGAMIIMIMLLLFYLDYVKFFISVRYHEGLKVIPVVLVAFFFYGIFFNQSVWYKLTKKTGYAILLTLVGAGITIIANVFFIKKYSYMAAAYGHLFAYFVMMLLSYFIGRKYYKINYQLNRILEYFIVALAIFGIRFFILPDTGWIKDLVCGFMIIVYGIYILYREGLLKNTLERIWK